MQVDKRLRSVIVADKKIVCLGGGSIYFHWGMVELVCQQELSGSQIMLYDLDAQKIEIVAAMTRRLIREAGTKMKVRTTTRLDEAVDGADFAVSSIGGSGAEITPDVYASRFHNADMRIPARYGIHQVIGDTAGPAGMMMALRAIPAYLKICRQMEKRCPRAILFNHSNPMAVLMRAMHKYTSINAIGICHGVQGGIQQAASVLGVPAAELECTWIGTNHFYWFTRVLHKGRDIYDQLRQKIRTGAPEDCRMAYGLSEIFGHVFVYASDDHVVEFFPFLAQTPGGQKGLPPALVKAAIEHSFDESKPTTRASTADRAAFFRQYRKLVDGVVLPPRELRSAGNTSGESVGGMMSAIVSGRRRVCIANIANRGSIPNLPPEAEVEVEAVTDSCGVRGVQMGDCPRVLKAILEKRFAWHELVADAAVTGDRQLALQALLIDEMAIWPDKARAMLDELLDASRELLPQFFHK
jgi:alpha-galactosidase